MSEVLTVALFEVTPLSCPHPLVLNHHGKDSPPCTVSCPSGYDYDDWQNLYKIVEICAPVSLFVGFYLFLTWFSAQEWRRVCHYLHHIEVI